MYNRNPHQSELLAYGLQNCYCRNSQSTGQSESSAGDHWNGQRTCVSGKSGTVSEIVCYGPFDRMPENLLDNLYWLGGWECRMPGFVKEMEEHGIVNPYRDIIKNNKVYLIDDNIDLTVEYIRQNYDENAEAVFIRTLGNVNLYQIQ